jgi:hypothetical protein
LVGDSCSADVLKQDQKIRFRWRRILQPFIAVIAHGSQILWGISSASNLVIDMPNRQSYGSIAVERVWITSRHSTHLTGVTVSLQHPSPSFLGDLTLECRQADCGLQKVLIRFQISSIPVRQDLVAFFVAQFSHSSRPLDSSAARGLNLSRFDNSSDVIEKEVEDSLL